MVFVQKCSLALFFFILSFLNSSNAQTSGLKNQDIGNPFIRWYNNKEYKAAASNWCILQDKRGVMYFGNESGLLEYDGLTWNRINIPYSANVRSLALDSSGTIFVCARSDIGYLKADSTGKLIYFSLLAYLPPGERDFGEAWDVVTTSKAVFFKTQDKIFRWDYKNFFIWDSIFAYRLYNIKDTIYSRNEGTGLMRISQNSINLVSNGSFFKSIGIFDMLPYYDINHPNQRILITTNYKGLFLYDGKTFTIFKTEADSFLKNNQIYNTCITMYGNYAFATQRGGLAILNSSGKLLKIIDESKGLQTNVIYDVYSSFQGSLWIATANGIALCEVPSPFSVIPNKGLLNGPVYSLTKQNNKVYAANDMGIIYAKDINNFSLVGGLNKPGVYLINIDNELFAGTNVGTGLIKNNKIFKMFIDNPTNIIVKSQIYKNRIYIGHRNGLSILEKNKINNYKVFSSNISFEITNIVEEKNGGLWIESFTEKIYYSPSSPVKKSSSNEYFLEYKQIKKEDGLPGLTRNMFNINGTMIMSTDKGIFSYNNFSRKFEKDKTLGKNLSGKNTFINLVTKTYNNSLWILSTTKGVSELGKAEYVNGTYIWKSNPIFNRIFLNSVYSIYSDYDSVNHQENLWISNDEGLFIYKEGINRNYKRSFKTLIRKVFTNNDSLIYGGTIIPRVQGFNSVLPFSDNNITFEVSAVSTDKPDANLYQYFLKGNDNDWSPWTSETKKVYTNLAFGTYYFRVRAKNIYGIIGTEDVYSLRVLAPWYLSWWALLIYTTLIISSVYFIDKLMRRRVVNSERTRARLRETELIKNQAYELEIVDNLVKVINRAEDLDSLFNSLLQQTLALIPQGEKASVLLYNKKENLFKVAFTIGYTKEELKEFYFTPAEIRKRYTSKSEELENGIYLIKDTRNLYGDDKIPFFKKSASMLVMEVNSDHKTEAYVVYDCFDEDKPFDHDSAGLLKRFHEHAVSAISKAQAMKTLKEKNEEILKSQEQLVSQQKLASLGALTAGIAHEIKNPLNFVNNFSEVNEELLDDLIDELNKGNKEEVMNLINDIKKNLSTISHHGKRADSIIKGMLLHSRGSSGEKVQTDINELIEQYITLAYHGLKAQNKEFNITIEKYYDKTINKINVVPQDISRVILNIINNAYYAVNEKKLKTNSEYTPTIILQTKNLVDSVEIRIKDNGTGISEKAKSKLFSPFFTTKPSGEGTGLGLSISYDIIAKQHSGEIRFESEPGECTEFIITLPK